MSGVVKKVLSLFMGDHEDDEKVEPGRRRSDDSARALEAAIRSPDPEVRRALAAAQNTRPDVLNALADDPDSEVRCAVAAHAATPARTRRRLADDADTDVRSVLARRIAHLAPGLTADEQDRLRRVTYETLTVLARDQAARVRRVLAETLKEMADAPPDVMRRLAADVELVVAAPVLEFSPVLTDQDLLEIIASPPSTGALAAISRRARVREPVADAIALTGDSEAIAVLLSNSSAQIREETLDALIDQAPGMEMWHDPLVRRPHLSPHAVARLAEFVADHLVDVLADRDDLDRETARKVAQEVKRRLKLDQTQSEDEEENVPKPQPNRSPYHQALEMYRAGRLEEDIIVSALQARDLNFVQAAIAVRSGLPEAVVRRTVAARSAKGVASLAWKAGLSMATAEALQHTLGRIPRHEILVPTSKGGYPLNASEMKWQLKFFLSLEMDSGRNVGVGGFQKKK